MTDESFTAPQRLTGIIAQIEALLFIAAEPLTIRQLAQSVECTAADVETALQELTAVYAGRGVQLQRHADQVQFVTAAQAAAAVARYLNLQPGARLSSAALEVLAIVAYRQPVTRAQIEAVRGVDSSATLRVLLARNLILEVGRLETAGRPILYGTDSTFLQHFGLTDLAQLPPLDHDNSAG
jgi:segregation and condensation protein B